MKKILFLMDDINYRGGAHFVTFTICNLLKENGNDVSIYSLTKPNQETYQYLTDGIHFAKSKNFEHYEYVVVPFENSIFKEEVANLKKIKGIRKRLDTVVIKYGLHSIETRKISDLCNIFQKYYTFFTFIIQIY